jgi:[ribosomal protein S5]-alanine N-acetyltransferase
VPTVQSRRLDLISMSPAFLKASLIGRRVEAARLLGAGLPPEWPRPAGRQLRRRLEQLTRDPTEQPWLLRAMVLRDDPDRPLVGYINFHAPPGPDGWVEVGYTVLPDFRCRGYAQEAVEALFDWATREASLISAAKGPTREGSRAQPCEDEIIFCSREAELAGQLNYGAGLVATRCTPCLRGCPVVRGISGDPRLIVRRFAAWMQGLGGACRVPVGA